MPITNYKYCTKTKAPAVCSIDCCGTKFGRAHINHALRPQSSSPKRKMRRYARHADKNRWRREIIEQIDDMWGYDPADDDLLGAYDNFESYYDDYEPYYDDTDYDPIDYDYEPIDTYPSRMSFTDSIGDANLLKIHDTIRESFWNGEITREKYHALVDVLFGRK